MTWLYRSIVANSGTSTRARLAHPAQVVAAQVDQHHVLGALLRVGEQLGGEPGVLAPGSAPRQRVPAIGCSSARRRPVGGLHLQVRLRRRADDVETVEAQQVHVRAGVGGPQHPVDVQRVGVGRALEALGHHDLEALAVADRLLGRLDRLGVQPLRRSARPPRRPPGRPQWRPSAGWAGTARWSSRRAGRSPGGRRRLTAASSAPRAAGSRWPPASPSRRSGRAPPDRWPASCPARAPAGRPRPVPAAARTGARCRRTGSRPARRYSGGSCSPVGRGPRPASSRDRLAQHARPGHPRSGTPAGGVPSQPRPPVALGQRGRRCAPR